MAASTIKSAQEDLILQMMQCELDMLSRPDGSAMFAQGNTVVMAAIYGPVENKLQNSDAYNAHLEVTYSGTSGLSTVEDRLRESLIKSTCGAALMLLSYPRTMISINLQIMQDAGSLLVCCLNACCLALLNAGLPMKYLFAAVSCVINENGEIIVDPPNSNESSNVAQLNFVFDSVEKSLLSCNTVGKFSASQFKECLLKCESASDVLFDLYRNIIKKRSLTM